MLYLVRHGRPLIDRGVTAASWELDPAGYDDIWNLRESGRLPVRAAWYTSPEPKATQTALLLTDGEVGVADDLREMVRESTDWIESFETVVRRAFERPDEPAYDGWETIAACRARLTRAVDGILAVHSNEDVVLVGHGTAWTVLAAALTATEPDVDRWADLGTPDVVEIDVDLRSEG